MGSRGLGELGRILLGSVSEGIIHHARHPVLVMRGGQSAWPPARVVIADDSSEHAKEAGELAASIGKLCGAEAVLARVYPSRLAGEDDAVRRTEEDLAQRADELKEILGRRPRTEVRQAGDPAGAILAAAQEEEVPALIAVGSRGLGTIQRIRLGSVSTKVLRAAAGPVLVHPHSRGS